jgi:putative membrane protein
LQAGSTRAFTTYEKGSTFYLNNTVFYIKLGLFAFVFALEIAPMVTLIRWRISTARGRGIGLAEMTQKSKWMLAISVVQAVLLVAFLILGPIMARGLWMRT